MLVQDAHVGDLSALMRVALGGRHVGGDQHLDWRRRLRSQEGSLVLIAPCRKSIYLPALSTERIDIIK